MRKSTTGKPSGVATATFYREENSLVSDAITELTVKVVMYKKKHGTKSVLLTGCNAACGTTRTSINLAVALSDSGFKTLLIDADLKAGSELKNGLSDYIQGSSDFDKAIVQTNLSNLDFVPSGSQTDNSALFLCSDKMIEFMKLIYEKYEFIIIDCPSLDVSPDAIALFANTDGIILVCSLNKTTNRQIANAKQATMPYSGKYYGMVVHSMEERRYKRHLRQRQWRVIE